MEEEEDGAFAPGAANDARSPQQRVRASAGVRGCLLEAF